MIGFAVYVAIGAMLHALVIGATFDWSSAWTFVWVLGWPIMLVITFWTAILISLAVMGGVWVAWEWLKTIASWRDKRRQSKAELRGK